MFRFLIIAVALPFAVASADNKSVRIWPNGAPDEPSGIEEKRKPDKMGSDNVLRVAFVNDPTLKLYPAQTARPTRTTVIVCPGGGYNILAWNKEGTEIAEWLNGIGVSAAVLKYRVPRRDGKKPHPWPLQDVQRAIRLVKHHGSDWKLDVDRVGVLGFSAGGHLTVMAGTHWDAESYDPVDDADKLGCRPDFLVPIYPAYLGDKENPGSLSPLVKVTSKTPPTFIAITQDDADRAIYASLLFVALKRAKVVAELHIYSKGGHGYGMRPSDNPVSTWPKRCEEWMRISGFLTKP